MKMEGMILPERRYKTERRVDLYTEMYEQYYFKNTPVRRLKPIRKCKNEKKKQSANMMITAVFFAVLLLFVLPFSFKNYICDVFAPNKKHVLNVDYEKLLFPTNSYIYSDLFLGKYNIKDTDYSQNLMVELTEGAERVGLKNSLIALAAKFPKIKPSVYVWEYNGKSYVNIDADEPYPSASIIKLPVLIEMFREIEAGKFSIDDEMVLEDYYRASGSGKLQYSQGGVAHSMDKLARIMIENSDNSATNMIMAKIGGMPEVNRAMRMWGLKTTHIKNWLPDLEGTNITTARELARMLYNVDVTDIVNSDSKKHIYDYMSHVKNNRLLQAGIPSEAILLHKTGDIGYMLGDAGIVKAPNGKKYIVVILARRPYNNFQGKEFIVEASKLIYNNIVY